MQVVAVGDPARVADTLKKLGDVETYDADGKASSQFQVLSSSLSCPRPRTAMARSVDGGTRPLVRRYA